MARSNWVRLVIFVVVVAALGFSPAAAEAPPDPCAIPAENPLCAMPPAAGAACVAVGLAVGGSVDLTFAESRAASGGQTHQERQLATRPTPGGTGNVVSSRCDAEAPPPEASANAEVASFSTDLAAQGVPVQLEGLVLAAHATATSGGGGNEATIEQGRLVVNGTEIALGANQAPNTVIPLGEDSFVVVNEQHQSPPNVPCRRNTGSALRIHLAELDVEVIVGWVSVVACRLPVNIETFTEPQGSVGPGQPVQDVAFVFGAGPTPTGSVAFFLCGPGEVTPPGCEAPNGSLVSVSPLFGGQAFSEDGFASEEPGRHCWRAEYSGDDVYLPGSHTNNDTECFDVVERVQPNLETFSEPQGAGFPPGVLAHDVAQLSGGQGPFNGSIAFFICSPGEVVPGAGCPAGGRVVSVSEVDGSGAAFSDPWPNTSEAGTYCWRAEYSGDQLHVPVTHTNFDTECFTVSQESEMRTDSQPAGGPHPPGIQVSDFARVFPNGPIPTGAVDFFLCRPMEVIPGQGCVQGGIPVGGAPLDPMGGAQSPGFGGTFDVGIWCWRAQYSGDANYLPATHTNFDTECFEIRQAQAQTQMTTRSEPEGGPHPRGIAVRDVATIQTAPGYPPPTGTVEFFLCRPFEVMPGFGCGGGIFVGASSVTMNQAFSPFFSATMDPGTYCWRAEYLGDANYQPTSHTNFDTECFSIA